jgi:3-phosphoshikimate 1-carboxyvinyltransferase
LRILVQPETSPWELRARMPGDKSLSHRALFLGAMAEGESVLTGLSESRDVRTTLRCLRALGARVRREGSGWVVSGWGRLCPSEPEQVLDCGGSGTTLRLLAGVLAAGRGLSVLTGDSSLRRRPMARVVQPLSAMGARVWGRGEGRLAPLVLQQGSLHALEWELPVPSAQVKSCLLLAGLQAGVPVALREPLPSRDHTERMLQALGVPLEQTGLDVRLTAPANLGGFSFAVPGDPSAAAFLVAAAVMNPGARVRIEGVSLNPGRLGFCELLRRMGAQVRWAVTHEELGEPVGWIEACGSELRGVEVQADEVPAALDELPLLAVVATRAWGRTQIRGAGELRHKECDRIHHLVVELRRMGACIREQAEGFEVEGPVRLRGAAVRCHGDHRLEMSLAVAALSAAGPTRLLGAGYSHVSFPEFWDLLPGRR